MSDLSRDIFFRMLDATWQASLLAIIVLALQFLPVRWLSPRWRCALWGIVFVRLMLPALPPRPWGIEMPVPVAQTLRSDVTITYGVGNPTLGEAVIPSATPPEQRVSVMYWLTIIWLSIAGALMLGRLLASMLFSRRLRVSPATSNGQVLELLRACAQPLHVCPPICIETDLVKAPALAGVLRPCLLLPHGLVERLSLAELRFVILHELAHLRRRDVLIGWITWQVAAMHWFNPMVWLAVARFRADRELACDADVLSVTDPTERITYGHTIRRVLELFAPSPRARYAAGAVGIVGSRRAVRRRISVISTPPLRAWPLLGPIVFIVLGCGALTGPRASTLPAPPDAAVEPAEPPGTVTRAYEIRDLILEFPTSTIRRQRAYVVVSRQTAFVADFERTVGDDSEQKLKPVIGIVDSGVVVGCRAQVSPDHQLATLTLAPQIATLLDLLPQRWPGSTPAHEGMIQIPRVQKVALNTTITMPGGKSALYRLPQIEQIEVRPGVVRPMHKDLLLPVRPTIIRERAEAPKVAP